MASNQNLELYKPAIAQLTDLLTITGTYVDQYYNVFLNPEPMDNIEIKAYGSDGEIQTVIIPNLAYLRQNCIMGNGSPEGVVEAPLGTFYLDTSVETNGLYIKQGNTLEVSNTGWGLLATAEAMADLIQQIDNLEDEVDNKIAGAINTHNTSPIAHPDIRTELSLKQNKIYAGEHIELSADGTQISGTPYKVPISINSGNINNSTGRGDILYAPSSGTATITWQQPVILEDGTIGTSELAVIASNVVQGNAYNPFDGQSSTFLLTTFASNFVMYFNNAINIQNFSFYTEQNLVTAQENYNPIATWQIDVSNDGSSWVTLGTFSGEQTWSQNCKLNYTGFYNYCRFIPLTPYVPSDIAESLYTAISGITINASYQKTITSADTLFFKVGGLYNSITYTNTYETLMTADNIAPLSVSSLSDGDYNILLDSSHNAIPVSRTIYRQVAEPLSTTNGDMWMDLSQDSYRFKSLINARQVYGATDGNTSGYINAQDVPTITSGTHDYLSSGVQIYATTNLTGSPIAIANGSDYYITKSSTQVISQVPYRSALDSVYSYWNPFDGVRITSNIHQGGAGSGYAKKNIPGLSRAYVDVTFSWSHWEHGDASFGLGSFYIWGGLRVRRLGRSSGQVIESMQNGVWTALATTTYTNTNSNLYLHLSGTIDNITVEIGLTSSYGFTWTGNPNIDTDAVTNDLDFNTSVTWYSGEGSAFEFCDLPEYVSMTIPAGEPEIYGSSSWEVIPYTPIGKITVSSGVITDYETFRFNDGVGKMANSSMIARYGMPDLDNYDSTTYTVGALGTPLVSGWLMFTNTTDTISVAMNGVNRTGRCNVLFPIPAGTSFQVNTSGTTIYWYPCIGEEWEY